MCTADVHVSMCVCVEDRRKGWVGEWRGAAVEHLSI